MFRLLLFLLILVLNTDLLSQWFETHRYYGIKLFEDIKFRDSTLGFIVGENGSIFKTTDFGINWDLCSTSSTARLHRIFFSQSSILVCGDSGTVLKSTDDGNSWRILPFPDRKKLYSIHMIDSLTGFAVGEYIFAKTTDGGESWIYSLFSQTIFRSLLFINDQIGFLACDSLHYSFIKKTTDGGNSWHTKVQYEHGPLFGFFFINSVGYVVGDNETVFRTTDFGENWYEPKPHTPSQIWDYTSVFFINELVGWVSGPRGEILKTTDGGYNWNLQRSIIQTGYTFYNGAIFFTDSLNGWTVGGGRDTALYGRILRTTNSGITFKEYDFFTSSLSEVKLHQNYPNPFNSTTNIKFSIAELGVRNGSTHLGGLTINAEYSNPHSLNQQFVTLKVYDVLGREVATLVNEEKPAGNYEITFNAELYNLTSGVYFYRLTSRNFSETKKLLILK
jgi:photosystem II stability/assembly factor-like uncharacterized protein